MEVIVILLACSLGLVAMALILFAYSVRQGDCDRSETLCLLPLDDDAPAAVEVQPDATADAAVAGSDRDAASAANRVGDT